jgi:hypothetical protein
MGRNQEKHGKKSQGTHLEAAEHEGFTPIPMIHSHSLFFPFRSFQVPEAPIGHAQDPPVGPTFHYFLVEVQQSACREIPERI